MNYQQLIDTMTAETYHSLTRSVELGKWPDGQALTAAQRENAMQAIIAWGQLHLEERDRVGFIGRKPGADESGNTPGEIPLNWKE